MHEHAGRCIAAATVLSAMPPIIAPLALEVFAYRLTLGYTPLLAFGDKPAFFLGVPQNTGPLNLFTESTQ
jgi:hypothetical protein